MNRYIGISLNDDYTCICINDKTVSRFQPTVIAKDKKEDEWTIGEDAYKATLAGSGVIVDKLLSLLEKNGTATISRIKYNAVDILAHYFHELLGKDSGGSEDDIVAVSIRKPGREIVNKLKEALIRAGVHENNIYIVSHTESFAHFVLDQDSSLYNRMVGMFELNNQCLYYYEMHVSRGTRRYVMVGSEAEEEAFNLDILKTASGGKIADKILSTVAERVMSKNSYSSVFLSGRGFQDTNFATNFMNFICKRRRVLIEPGMFAIGAEIYVKNMADGKNDEYMILCDTRCNSDVSVKVLVNEKIETLPIVRAGESWMDTSASYEMILDDQDFIDFQVTSITKPQRPLRLRMMLDTFPQRESRTTRIRMSTEFADADTLRVTVKDLGFGDLFPASDKEIVEEIDLSEK
ncbi:DUF5716 family protein [Oribacterium sp. WCC10]|uniref:DUF5716 family protein n=1 Tax=Oribacterium sp. WCC10 TaxID=1855343 RepID=UPI0008ECD6D5|nr:DUF5716 family protein [Oribacterium sp. WCC10]SFG19446.1 hypothetical protein SAMN05216356_10375 [Oribacterium sp. WCC10]